MSGVQGFMQILGSIWDGFFSLRSPFFNLTFKQIFIGIFVVIISNRILWPLLGLGGSVVNGLSRQASRTSSRIRSSRSRSRNSD